MSEPGRSKACLIIGIAGPSGSGKSFIAEHILAALAAQRGMLLSQDDYYRDRSDLTLEKRQLINYDHPEAIEFTLLAQHLRQLAAGEAIEHPLYDFSIHNRKPGRRRAGPADVVVVDGLLLYALPEMRSLFDLKIYVDTPLDICFIRRLQRDVLERKRTMESVIQQYTTTVRPMFVEFVQASRAVADLVVPGEEPVEEVLPQILEAIALLNPALRPQMQAAAAVKYGWRDSLLAEHELLLRGLALLEAEARVLQDEEADGSRLHHLCNFLLAFGDRIHNVKEENHLFPLLVELGIPHDGLIKEMLLDHEAEREMIASWQVRLARLGQSTMEEKALLARQIAGYSEKRRTHIRAEDEALYPRAAEVIPLAQGERLMAGFAKVEALSLYPNAARHFSALLGQWEQGDARK